MSIALKIPRIYPIFASILSTIICSLSDKKKIIDLVVKKFKNKSNSEYLFLWLQRIAIVAGIKIKYMANNYLISVGSTNLLWNSKDWLNQDFHDIMTTENIIDKVEINRCLALLRTKKSIFLSRS
ncbi:MAG: hypothetical protein H0A76_09455 [Candidatus Thiodubiliella endoseptemdiera]|uniref:Uncharacterized protein n=1 Tax=Candidatus Thiodubiliella endoseptemdiera TaxID=2738886 RepID=A0A853F3W5_9GAMM|nr:hypothetical protein [Candidatus Thiodubiliella endoseptemdiera]